MIQVLEAVSHYLTKHSIDHNVHRSYKNRTTMITTNNPKKFTTIKLLRDAAVKGQHTVYIVSSLCHKDSKIQENEINMADPQLLPKILQQIVS
jgi:hypothetical protein